MNPPSSRSIAICTSFVFGCHQQPPPQAQRLSQLCFPSPQVSERVARKYGNKLWGALGALVTLCPTTSSSSVPSRLYPDLPHFLLAVEVAVVSLSTSPLLPSVVVNSSVTLRLLSAPIHSRVCLLGPLSLSFLRFLSPSFYPLLPFYSPQLLSLWALFLLSALILACSR